MAKKIYTDEEVRLRKNARQKEYAKRSGYAANNKYNKEKTKSYAIRMMKSSDSDIIDWLEEQFNKAGYIKGLIREDMIRAKENLKSFKDE